MNNKQHASNNTQQQWSSGKENNNKEISIKRGLKMDDNDIKDRNVDNTKDKIPMEVDNKVKSNKEDLDNVRDDDNLSDDEDQEEFDEATTEIPTLETYIPRKPTYYVANAIPFAELCKR